MDLEDEQWWSGLESQLALLGAENKQLRRKTLDSLLTHVHTLPKDLHKLWPQRLGPGPDVKVDSDDEDDTQISLEEGDCTHSTQLKQGPTAPQLNQLIKALLSRLQDPVEKCRELSYLTLTQLFSSEGIPNQILIHHLPRTIPLLLDRLGQQELIESSEEVRLLAVTFMQVILERCTSSLAPFVDDWIRILSVTLLDPFHQVRRSSCDLVSSSGRELTSVFHYNSERLNKPLVISVTHQQSKVRQACVKAIGDVLLYGSHKSIEEFIPHLTQRLFDPQPPVRKAVVEVAGLWMLDYVDRYSYFHKMMPLLITGLCDECDEVREVSYSLWEKVGEKYLEENIEEYKDQVDFPAQIPSHYPEDVKRPNFGCRLLTQRNACKIIPGITNDITDWVETTRLKCAQLLFHLILNCEENMTMHTESVLQCLFKSALDPQPLVSQYVLHSALLMGYFVPLSTSWMILSSRLRLNPNEAALGVTASLLKATEGEVLRTHVSQIATLVADPEICHTLKCGNQFRILQICESLIKVLTPGRTEEGQELFGIILGVLGMTSDGDIKARALVCLNDLKLATGLEELDDLFCLYLGSVLTEIKNSDVLWGPSSAENLIFSAALIHGGSAVESHLGEILDILLTQLDPKKEAEVRLNLFTLLSEILLNYSTSDGLLGSHNQKVQLFVQTIVDEILSPNLIWKAGKTSSALRSAALSCLLITLEHKLLSSQNCQSISAKLITGLLGLLEDGCGLNRLLSVQCLGHLASCVGSGGLDALTTHKIYPELLKRLDDENLEVRVSAGKALGRLFSSVAPDAISNTHLDYLVNVMLVHLDAEETEVRLVVEEGLQVVGKLCPEVVIGKCQSFRGKHRSTDNCDRLIAHLQVDKRPT